MQRPIERIFLGWDEPALSSAAAHLVSSHIVADEIRLDGVVIVLPGSRAGRRLLELLLAEAESSGLRLVPPRITTIGALPELLYRSERPTATPILASRVWALALAGLEHDLITQLFPHPPESGDLRGWAILGQQADRLYRELGGAGLRFSDVAESCRAGLIHDDADRWDLLALAANDYLDRLARLGYTDREGARLTAIEEEAIGTDQEIWLVGVVDIPVITRRMIRLLDSPLHLLIHAPPELADTFDELGCIITDAWLDAMIPIRDEDLHIVDRPADQATAAYEALASLSGRFTADEITIGVPDRENISYIEERFSAAGLPIRYATGEPLHRSGPYRLLEAIANYLDGHRSRDLANLLRHPDLWRWLRRYDPTPSTSDLLELGPLGESMAEGSIAGPHFTSLDSWLGALDRYFSDSLPAHLRGRLPGRGSSRDEVAKLVDALDDDSFLGGLGEDRLLAEWAPIILDLLVEVYGNEPLDRDRMSDRRILDACAGIRTAAAGFYNLPPEVDERCSAATAIRLILAEAANELLVPEADRASIELLGWLELHLDDAPLLLITGVNEPYLPESVNADAFLPNSARAKLGLLDNDLRYARDAYQLTAILHSRPEVRLIAGRRDAAGDPLRPSRLLFAAPPETLARRIQNFFSEEESPLRVTPTLHHGALHHGALHHGAPHLGGEGNGTIHRFTLPPEPVITAPAPITRFRVTDFRTLLADPYRFALERLLRLEAVHDEARELDPLRFGILAHDILQRFGSGEYRNETDPDRLRRHLGEILDDEVHFHFGDQALPAVRVQVEQLRARLRAFAGWQAEWASAGWQIMGVEASTPDDGVPLDVDGEPIHLTARIDRIDYNPEAGQWAVFDYKTGDLARDPEKTHRAGRGDDRRWIDLQLPLYHHLLPALQNDAGEPLIPADQLEVVRLGFILLPRELGSVGESMADWDDFELGDAVERARDVVRELRETRYTFEFTEDSMRTRPGDPMAALLGVGQLSGAFDDDEGGDE